MRPSRALRPSTIVRWSYLSIVAFLGGDGLRVCADTTRTNPVKRVIHRTAGHRRELS